MSKKSQLVPYVVTQDTLVNVDITVDKDDVAAVLIARAEDSLTQTIADHKTTDTRLKRETAALGARQVELMQAAADKYFVRAAGVLQDAAKALKCKHIETEVSLHGTTTTDMPKPTLSARLCVSAAKPDVRWCVSAEVPMSAELRKVRDAADTVAKKIKTNNDAWYATRTKISDLPRLARRAHAVIAESRLRETATGEQLLAQLDGQLENGLKLLGGV